MYINFTITQIITRVKIMVAPTGIPAKYARTYPVAVPVNPAAIDQRIILEYTFVKIMAIFGGIVSRERTSTTPAILMFRTIVRAISAVVIYLKTSTYEE